MIIDYNKFIKEEVGIRNLKNVLMKDKENNIKHSTAEIYFHQDLDGVASAIAIKTFLKTYYSITTVDTHFIQYGANEYAAVKPNPENLAVLVDYAHGKAVFDIHTDHHQQQVGGDLEKSTLFKHASANADTISSEISYNDIFTSTDIDLIKMVDSADFITYDIKPEDLGVAIIDKGMKDKYSAKKCRFLMGLVVNRLLLAYKNKKITVKSIVNGKTYRDKNLLECLVLDSNPSLWSMYNNIVNYIKNATSNGKPLATQEELTNNLNKYVKKMQNYKIKNGNSYEDGLIYDKETGVIYQYDGGYMIPSGSYDRYTAYRNYPDSKVFCMVWSMGLIQVSYNPFNKNIKKDINMIELTNSVLDRYKEKLSNIFISLYDIKKHDEDTKEISKNPDNELTNFLNKLKDDSKDENGNIDYKLYNQTKQETNISDLNDVSMGLSYNDIKSNFDKDLKFKNQYTNKISNIKLNNMHEECLNTPFNKLSFKQKNYLSNVYINAYDIIKNQSCGHVAISNMSGFDFLDYDKPDMKKQFGVNNYKEVLKIISKDVVKELKSKLKK